MWVLDSYNPIFNRSHEVKHRNNKKKMLIKNRNPKLPIHA